MVQFNIISLSLFKFHRYFVLGLPTGSTPLGMYRALIEFYKQGKVSFRYVKTFNMDEYVGKCGGFVLIKLYTELKHALCRSAA